MEAHAQHHWDAVCVGVGVLEMCAKGLVMLDPHDNVYVF